MIYRNKKNGCYYVYICEVKNTTNINDGQIMILYRKECVESVFESTERFVREKSEFFEKFELVNSYD